jgi:hypothetical protein
MAVAESLGVGGDKQLNHQGWGDEAELSHDGRCRRKKATGDGGRPRLDTRRERSMLLSVQCKM